MPKVFEPDFFDDFEYVAYLLAEEVQKYGYQSLFYHIKTGLIVIRARDHNEAVECIKNFLNTQYEENPINFGDTYPDLILNELYNLTGKDLINELWNIWRHDNELRQQVYNKLFIQGLRSEVVSELPSRLKEQVDIELKSMLEHERLLERIGSIDFEKAREFYFVRSRVRSHFRQKGFSPTAEIIDGKVLNEIITDILDKAIKDAESKNRKTVEIEDFKIFTQIPFVPYKEFLFVKSMVRNYIESKGYTPSDDVLDGGILNKIISDLLDKAITKAMADNRSIIGRIDFE
ncbi:MAG: hypothetical protein ACFE8E_14670 [Candidatus Hodarchaeota archaeon]